MNLDSVRALKTELAERVVRPLLESGPVARSLGGPTTANRRMTGVRAGIALGIARGPHDREYRLAVRVQRRSVERIPGLNDILAERAHGEIDIRYIGEITKRQIPWQQTRQRPLVIGCSLAHFAVTAGTLGAFVRVNRTGALALLSNNHVLADEDYAQVGDDVLQPGSYDGGSRPDDVVGALDGVVRLQSAGNLADAAIASIAAHVDVDVSQLPGLGVLRGMRAEPIEPGDVVQKIGRTTGITRGIVTAIEVDDVVVGYDRGALSFDRQIEIEGADDDPFSAGGDSGSLILDADLRGCGLLFAGGDTGGSNGQGLTYANDLATVLQLLDITLAV